MREIRPKLTYANVVATIALFGMVAGGGAYAASKIGPKDIAKNAVRSKHIKDGQVKAGDLKAIVVREDTQSVSGGSGVTATATCEAGQKVIAGGADWSNASSDLDLIQSYRDGNGWTAKGENNLGITTNFTAFAYCMKG